MKRELFIGQMVNLLYMYLKDVKNVIRIVKHGEL